MKTSDLMPPELDKYVALIEGTAGYHDIDYCEDSWYSSCKNCGEQGSDENNSISSWDPLDNPPKGCKGYRHYSTSWSQGGPLIEKYLLGVEQALNDNDDAGWVGYLRFEKNGISEVWGPTPLIAAMRAIVASVYGENVDEH